MAAAYRFNLTRSVGWFRLGVAAAVAVICITPMLWALGVFGPSEDAVHRAVIFGFSGIWLGLAVGYLVGWALTGFMVKVKDGEGEEKESRRPEAPHRPTIPAPAPAGRQPQH